MSAHLHDYSLESSPQYGFIDIWELILLNSLFFRKVIIHYFFSFLKNYFPINLKELFAIIFSIEMECFLGLYISMFYSLLAEIEDE